ncbi:MAG: hypothetical protein AUH78_20600 [Gemmatimonadetes bacterium 13_1_40CM_4_69_8]|uniref:Uncharacterized protein n=1 Tax=Candidatus Segetimicrobium genomatis TaxID=2569760 RepID=A0A537IRD8_9BACT|nr:MAG: hypothetical protein AUH78_20600 [Gemmatimonadetes bacterium 13_1_40CM_4_69_8]TMI73903.1 MAG: hypothetical protein E6H05_08585 [Terrabacteria group bacterium ANGP1]
MRTIWRAGGLLFGAALMVTGCTEENSPTTLRRSGGAAFDAAASLTSAVTDLAGDAAWNFNTGPGSAAKVPAYLDIVRAEVSQKGRTFTFTLDLAEIVPASPAPASGGLGVYDWFFELDTDPTTFPSGKDGVFPQNQALPVELFVAVEWDGTQFKGLLFDLRPLLSGEPMIITPVAFSIGGAEIQLSVAASALGDPSTFGWAAATCARHSHYASDGIQCLDRAPDAGFVTWPQ